MPLNESGKRHRSNKSWMHEHVNDPYVKRAKAEGWRSRAAFKLIEIDAKDKLLKPGMAVVDLGSAPGSWSQVAAKRLKPNGILVALDLLEMESIPDVAFIQGDFREEDVLKKLEETLAGRQVDLVLSDMAPNMSGVGVSDQARVMYLAELTLDFCRQNLKPGGDLLFKVFMGAGFEELRTQMRKAFSNVQVRKPEASRDRSAETFLLARGRK